MPTILNHNQSFLSDNDAVVQDQPNTQPSDPAFLLTASSPSDAYVRADAGSGFLGFSEPPFSLSNSPSLSLSPPRTPTFAPTACPDTPARSPALSSCSSVASDDSADAVDGLEHHHHSSSTPPSLSTSPSPPPFSLRKEFKEHIHRPFLTQAQDQDLAQYRNHNHGEPTARSKSISGSGSGSDHDQAQAQGSFALLTHPAIVYASERLSDEAYTAGLDTVNVFDFDQTLFQSPLPNPALWDPAFLGILTSWNYCGTGWWHNPGTLELGPKAEASCWEGWWNEEIVKKVHESSEKPGSLTVLLTGRNGPTFGDKLIEMVRRKGLDFDLIATKPTTVARLEKIKCKDKVRTTVNDTNGANGATTASTSFAKKSSLRPVERYLKVHTFNTKHEFLYSVLFEYPKIKTMHLWDDRPCQVAKFRQVGQEWLDNKMLDQFGITVVHEPLLFMDPEREIDLVLSMVEANNHQVDIEASGGPFLVPGVGDIPRTRPELRDRHIWDPYETYVPQTRVKIEVDNIVRYTGVMFSEAIQNIMRIRLGGSSISSEVMADHAWIERPNALSGQDLSKWVVPDDLHVTLCLGSATPDHLDSLGGLGATVLMEVEAVGSCENRIWALKVKELDIDSIDNDPRELQIVAPDGQVYSSIEDLRSAYANSSRVVDSVLTSAAALCGGDHITMSQKRRQEFLKVDLDRLGHIVLFNKDITPHVTMAYDRLSGTRAVDSGKITEWEHLTSRKAPRETAQYDYRLVFVGTIGEKKLLGMKSRKAAGTETTQAAEVSLGNIIKSLTGDQHLTGKELGEMIKNVKEEMERLSVENRVENEERIATIAQEICDRAETQRFVQH